MQCPLKANRFLAPLASHPVKVFAGKTFHSQKKTLPACSTLMMMFSEALLVAAQLRALDNFQIRQLPPYSTICRVYFTMVTGFAVGYANLWICKDSVCSLVYQYVKFNRKHGERFLCSAKIDLIENLLPNILILKFPSSKNPIRVISPLFPLIPLLYTCRLFTCLRVR